MIDTAAVEAYIREAAAKRGIDPDVAVRVAKSEGLGPGVYQSKFRKNGVREPSFGPFQLLVGGDGTGYPTGMGNDFIRQTGLDPRDPSTVNAQVDFALDGARRTGWQPWYGAKRVGIQRWEGVKPGVRSVSSPPAMPEPILGADARQAAQQQQVALQAAPPTTTMPMAQQQSPIGNMFSSMMGAFQPPAATAAMPRVMKDDSGALASAAAQLSDKGKQLKSQFLPNVDAILGLSKPGGVVI